MSEVLIISDDPSQGLTLQTSDDSLTQDLFLRGFIDDVRWVLETASEAGESVHLRIIRAEGNSVPVNAAYIAAIIAFGRDFEEEAFKYILGVEQRGFGISVPLLTLADQILERNGAVLAAVKKVLGT